MMKTRSDETIEAEREKGSKAIATIDQWRRTICTSPCPRSCKQ